MHDSTDALEQARAAFERRDWDVARERLAAADDAGVLGAEDLRRLAQCAYLTGHDEQAEDAWARAHQSFLDDGDVLSAVRCAFWLGMVLVAGQGAEARGGGWLARAQRLVEDHAPQDCAERGYLLLPAALAQLDAGAADAAHASFGEATAIGRRVDEPDLVALGRLGQGQALIRLGQARRGTALLDEAMVAVEAGGVSSIASGLLYCAVILACQQVFDLRRAQQWTAALDGWCASQSGLVPYRGQCLVHRSQLAALRGDWEDAVAEADRACAWLSDPPDPAAGMAWYQRAELHRLHGEHDAAEAAYAQAAGQGHDPHPGLALLWLAQGRAEAAAAAIRRLVDEPTRTYPPVADEVRDPRPRAEVLGACVEVMLAVGDLATARAASAELVEMADALGTPLVTAVSTRARGALLLEQGHFGAALDALVHARACWMQLHAPYETARTRVLVARALEGLGDDDTAAIERRAAEEAFEQIGATPDLERLAAPSPAGARGPAAGLTSREVEVIRLVAAGLTNREVAEQLVISDKTVARHLHNVFTKLDLPNRSAATAYAYEHDLV